MSKLLNEIVLARDLSSVQPAFNIINHFFMHSKIGFHHVFTTQNVHLQCTLQCICQWHKTFYTFPNVYSNWSKLSSILLYDTSYVRVTFWKDWSGLSGQTCLNSCLTPCWTVNILDVNKLSKLRNPAIIWSAGHVWFSSSRSPDPPPPPDTREQIEVYHTKSWIC